MAGVADDVERLRWELSTAIRRLPPEKLQEYLRGHVEELAKLHEQAAKLQKAFETVEELKEQLSELHALGEPPLQYGVFLGVGKKPETPLDSKLSHQDGDSAEGSGNDCPIIAGVNGQRYEVRLAAPGIGAKDLREGQGVVLNKMLNIVGVRNHHLIGDTAEVVNVLSPDGAARVDALPEKGGISIARPEGGVENFECDADLRAELRPGDLVTIDEQRKRALGRAKPRLHVRSGGTEGIVVEVGERLAREGVAIGDIVRVDTRLQFAFEKLPAYETGGLALEEVPDVTYEDVAGLEDQIAEIQDAIDLPYIYAADFEELRLSRPKGILLHGPPGCGKTMIAKAVANSLTQTIRAHLDGILRKAERYQVLKASDGDDAKKEITAIEAYLRRNRIEPDVADRECERIRDMLQKDEGIRSFFLNVKGPELLNKYIGETEHRIRKIFEEAKRRASFHTPVVIFFDEMEAMFRTRGSGLSSDVETTIVPQFLAEMDGVEAAENVILVGATNRPELIDPAILRPGRLDIKIRINRPHRKAAMAILALHLTPDLPMDPTGLTLRDRGASITFASKIVVRTLAALAREYRLPPERLKSVQEAITSRCDMRGTLERESAKLDELAREDRDIARLTEQVAGREWLAEAMIVRAVAILFDPGSRLEAVTISGKRYTHPLHEFVGGALLTSIVARAKKAALKRRVAAKDGPASGISIGDMRTAIRDEFEGSKEQLVASRLGQETGERPGQPADPVQIVDLFLEERDADPHVAEKIKVYRYRKVAS